MGKVPSTLLVVVWEKEGEEEMRDGDERCDDEEAICSYYTLIIHTQIPYKVKSKRYREV